MGSILKTMKNIVVNYSETKINVGKKIENDLQWYDAVRQEMLYFKGASLAFEYKEDPYLVSLNKEERVKRGIMSTWRMLPRATTLMVKDIKNISNEKIVKKWFNSYLNYNNSDISIDELNKNNISFNVPDKEIDDFTFELDRKKFDYTIND